MKKTVLLTGILSMISLSCLCLMYAALVDIWRGEPDVAQEWLVVSWGFVPLFVFHAVTIITLLKFWRKEKA